jgi:hypothetical protein
MPPGEITSPGDWGSIATDDAPLFILSSPRLRAQRAAQFGGIKINKLTLL